MRSLIVRHWRRMPAGWDRGQSQMDDEENGEVTPTKMTPHQFIDWFEHEEIDSDWLPLFIDIIVGKPAPGEIDFIPLQMLNMPHSQWR